MLQIVHSFWKRHHIGVLKGIMETCGNEVSIPHSIRIHGQHLRIGNDVALGEDCLFMCAGAPIIIGDHVMLGPRVTMITGDHRIDMVGKYMSEVKIFEKLPENNQPIVLEGDNWIGANATILKGVTVGEGAVVAAGALVTKDVPPYTVVGGVPARKLRDRFDETELVRHKQLLKERQVKDSN